MTVWAVLRAVLIFSLVTSALAQSSARQPTTEENLASKVTNPIAFLTRITVENQHSPTLWDSNGEENEAEAEFVIPYQAFSRGNLARVKVIFKTSAPDGTHGLSESQIFDLLLFDRNWGTFGAGISVDMTAENSTLGALAPGPAIGAVVKHGRWRYGLFNQNFLSDTLAQSELQPILSYTFNSKWSAEIGDAQYTYDWKKSRMTLIPINGQLNRILSFETTDIHLFFRAQY